MSHIPRGLMDRQARLLSMLAVRPSLTRAGYQKLAGLTRGTAHKDLQELVAAGLIERLGSSRSARYALASIEDVGDVSARALHDASAASARLLPVCGAIEHERESRPQL